MGRFSDELEHAGQDFQAEILFIASPIGSSLNHPDLIVEPLHEPKRDLVRGVWPRRQFRPSAARSSLQSPHRV